MIENATLREFVAKGTKYEESNRVKWKATEPVLLESIDLGLISVQNISPKEKK